MHHKSGQNRQNVDIEQLKAGIRICDILDDFGIRYRHHRSVCPIHGGDNPSAFSFNDDTFYCHTRGCKGDVLTLVQSLAKTDFQGAVAILARRKGVQLPEFAERSRSNPVQSVAQLTPESAKDILRRRLSTNCSLRIFWTRRLRELRDKRRLRLISECDYYTKTLIADMQLEALDAKEAALNWKLHHA